MKLVLIAVLSAAAIGCSPADMFRMQRGATNISAELRSRYGVQPEVNVDLQNVSTLHVTITVPLAAVRTYTAGQLHAHAMDAATKHLDKRPDHVYVVIATGE